MDSDYQGPTLALIPVPAGATSAGATNLVPFIKSNRELVLGNGFYTLDETKLPATVSNFKIHGQHSNAGVSSGGTVITITAAISTADSTDFIDTEWWNLTFTSSDTTANDAQFKGFNNLRNYVHDCLYVGFGPKIAHTHGAKFKFQRNRIIDGPSPPSHENCNIIAPISCLVTDNDWDFSATLQNGTNAGIVVGGAGATMNGQTFSEWIIERNLFDHSDGANSAVDSFCDCEADQATVPPTYQVRNNIVTNGKICFSAAPSIEITGNITHVTTNALAQANAGCAVLQFATGTAGHEIGTLIVERNILYQDNVAAPTWDWRGILLNPPNGTAAGPQRTYRVAKNVLFLNGQASVPANGAGPITLLFPAAGAAMTLDYLDISDNVIGMSTVPVSTPSAAIVIMDGSSAATVTRASVRRNRLMGTLAGGSVYPPTIAGAFTYLLNVGQTGKTTTITQLDVTDNRCEEAALSGPTASAPFLVTKAGTVAITGFKYSGNTPRLSNFLSAQAAAVATVVSLAIPAGFPDMDIEVGGFVNVTAATTDSIALSSVITPETSGAAQTYPHALSTPSTGALIFATTANTTGNFPATKLRARAKAGTTVTIKTSGTFTTVTYDVGAEIELKA